MKYFVDFNVYKTLMLLFHVIVFCGLEILTEITWYKYNLWKKYNIDCNNNIVIC